MLYLRLRDFLFVFKKSFYILETCSLKATLIRYLRGKSVCTHSKKPHKFKHLFNKMDNFKVHINFNVKAMSLQRFSAGSKSFQTYLNTSCVSTKCQFPQFNSYRKLLGKQPLSLLSNGCLTYLLHHRHNTERILQQALKKSKLIKPQVARVC